MSEASVDFEMICRVRHEDRLPYLHLYSVIDHSFHIIKMTSAHLCCDFKSCHSVITETVTLNLKESLSLEEKKKDGQISGREIFFAM